MFGSLSLRLVLSRVCSVQLLVSTGGCIEGKDADDVDEMQSHVMGCCQSQGNFIRR